MAAMTSALQRSYGANLHYSKPGTFLLSRPFKNCRCELCTLYVQTSIENSINNPIEPLMIPFFSTSYGWWNVRLPSEKFELPAPLYMDAVYIDEDVMHYLEEKKVINWCSAVRKLHPIRTTGDGNCLMHAVILATTGLQDCGMVLRRLVYVALVEASANSLRDRWKAERERLNESVPGGVELSPEEWDKEWNMIVRAAEDLRQNPGSEIFSASYAFLEEMHVFVLANVLRRPIIILGESTVRSPLAGDSIEHNNFVGIYLPLLWYPQACSPNPIMLCFQMNHFQPLITRYLLASEKKPRFAVPLVNALLEPLHIHFLLPGENHLAHSFLQEYLFTSEVTQPSSDGKNKDIILVADFELSLDYYEWEFSDYYYLTALYASAPSTDDTKTYSNNSPKLMLKEKEDSLALTCHKDNDVVENRSHGQVKQFCPESYRTCPACARNLRSKIPNLAKQSIDFDSNERSSGTESDLRSSGAKYVRQKYLGKAPVYWREASLVAKRCEVPVCEKFVVPKTDPFCIDHYVPVSHTSKTTDIFDSDKNLSHFCHCQQRSNNFCRDIAVRKTDSQPPNESKGSNSNEFYMEIPKQHGAIIGKVEYDYILVRSCPDKLLEISPSENKRQLMNVGASLSDRIMHYLSEAKTDSCSLPEKNAYDPSKISSANTKSILSAGKYKKEKKDFPTRLAIAPAQKNKYGDDDSYSFNVKSLNLESSMPKLQPDMCSEKTNLDKRNVHGPNSGQCNESDEGDNLEMKKSLPEEDEMKGSVKSLMKSVNLPSNSMAKQKSGHHTISHEVDQAVSDGEDSSLSSEMTRSDVVSFDKLSEFKKLDDMEQTEQDETTVAASYGSSSSLNDDMLVAYDASASRKDSVDEIVERTDDNSENLGSEDAVPNKWTGIYLFLQLLDKKNPPSHTKYSLCSPMQEDQNACLTEGCRGLVRDPDLNLCDRCYVQQVKAFNKIESSNPPDSLKCCENSSDLSSVSGHAKCSCSQQESEEEILDDHDSDSEPQSTFVDCEDLTE